ncbi:MAG: aminotransferase class III-fold pyridoxal phosphate-dependent enzyme, partial [Candidatus Dadabacteria bacterium]
YGALVIADEVMTGFGRTGKNFAFDHIESNPDLICLSKGLTGGFLPLGVTACTAEIFEAFLSDDKKEMFTHGHSFTANPLSCAAAVESVTILAEDKTQAAIKRISGLNREFVEELKSLKGVNNPRCRGTVLALEIEADDDSSYFGAFRDRLYRYFIENRVILRPLGNTVYIIPPYCITGEQLKRVYEVIVAAVEGGDVRVV